MEAVIPNRTARHGARAEISLALHGSRDMFFDRATVVLRVKFKRIDGVGAMDFDVFISYPSEDRVVAFAACAKLEAEGVRCWIAPRDVPPGVEWAGALVDAIDHCRAMVLIFSSRANESEQVRREVQRAFNRGVPVVPFRIENVVPEKSLAFFMESVHWLDALTPPLEQHLQKLATSVKSFVHGETADGEENKANSPRKMEPPRPWTPEPRKVWPPSKGALIALSALGVVSVGSIGLWLGAAYWTQVPSAQQPARSQQVGVATSDGPRSATVATVGTATLQSGLIGYWPLKSDTINWTTNTAQDTSGNGNNGSMVGISSKSTTPGKVGGALKFNGNNSYVKMTDDNFPAGTAARSISIRIKTSQGVHSFTFPIIIEYGTAGIVGEYYGLCLCPSAIDSCNYAPAGAAAIAVWGSSVTTSRAVNDGVWHHLVATFDGRNHRLYLDGMLQGSAALVTNTALSGDLYIGGPHQSPSIFFDGAIDEVRVYNRAISAQEVAQLYSMSE
ncbi:MAG: LamG-like jellyroll fold domain-containing protein [Methylocystis sp.]